MDYTYSVVLVYTANDGSTREIVLKQYPTRPDANCYANYADHLFDSNGYQRDEGLRWKGTEGVFELDVRRSVVPVSQ